MSVRRRAVESPDSDVAVQLSGVTKLYEAKSPTRGWWSALPWYSRAPSVPAVALNDVDLAVTRGSSVALIGPNGAGKSTALRIVAGITEPTRGGVVVRGSVGSLIELGVGFHPDLTGWQNLRCSARLLGLSREEVRGFEHPIAEFAGLGEAMDAPLRTYSAGMAARLGFAIATAGPCDVLVVDEVLAVGDQEFRDRCFERIRNLLDVGTTLLFVTHEMPLVPRICERAVHFRAGRIVDDGSAADVIRRYLGGSPARYRQMDPSPVQWRSFRNSVRRQTAGEPVRLEAEVEVHSTVRELRLSVEFTLPIVGEELAFASCATTLAGTLVPGRYRMRATGRPFPATSGQCRAVATLLSPRDIEVLDIARDDFPLEGPWTDSMPRLVAAPAWHVEPMQGGAADGQPGSGSLRRSSRVRAELSSVWKVFKSARSGPGGANRVSPPEARRVTALRGVDLWVGAGESLGVIGGNGAGKSTALGVIAGTVHPDSGSVRVEGSVVPLLGLGLGFHPELTGRQNARLSATLLGLGRREVAEMLPEVETLSELGEHFGRPVRTYSSGMEARLGLAIGLLADPDVLLIDEVLAVGDEAFRRRAMSMVSDLRRGGTAVVLVSHDLETVAEACDTAVQLSQGEVVDAGPVTEVLERYAPDGRGDHAISRLQGMEVRNLRALRPYVATGDALAFEGELHISDPSDTAWVELRYDFVPDERPTADNSEALQRTFLRSVVEPAGGALAVAGRHRFNGSVPDNAFYGDLWMIVAVLDLDAEGNEVMVSQAWYAARVGRSAPQIMIPLDLEWTIEKC